MDEIIYEEVINKVKKLHKLNYMYEASCYQIAKNTIVDMFINDDIWLIRYSILDYKGNDVKSEYQNMRIKTIDAFLANYDNLDGEEKFNFWYKEHNIDLKKIIKDLKIIKKDLNKNIKEKSNEQN